MSEDAVQLLSSLGSIEEGEALVRLTQVKALLANGREAEAKVLIRDAREALLDRASRITNPAWRESVLTCVPENAEILALSRKLVASR